MSFFGKKGEEISGISDRKYVIQTELSYNGQDVKSLLESYVNIDVLTEVEYLIQSLNNGEVTSQEARDILAPVRDKLSAKIALIQAVYAILPKRLPGESSPKLSKRKTVFLDQT